MKITSITPCETGLDAVTAESIFDHVNKFASYGFNKSHAAAYASISFQTASLKAHHPEAFFAASMNMAIGEVEDIAVFAGELKTRGITLLAPNINQSLARFKPIETPTGIAVAYGLSAMRGVGTTAANDIIAERVSNGLFSTLENFRERMRSKINKKALTSLIYSGAFDSIIDTRADAIAIAEGRVTQNVNQMSFFDMDGLDTRETIEEFPLEDKLAHEFSVLGFWHSDHPLKALAPAIRRAKLSSLRALKQNDPLPKTAWLVGGVINADMRGTKSGGMMGIVTLSDSIDVYETVAFDETWASIRGVCKKAALVAIQVTIIEDNGTYRLMIQKAVPLEEKLGLRKGKGKSKAA